MILTIAKDSKNILASLNMSSDSEPLYGISFAEAFQVEPFSPFKYKTNIHPDYCYGPGKLPISCYTSLIVYYIYVILILFVSVANGGCIVSLLHSCVTKHFQQLRKNEDEVNTFALHVEFLRQSAAGPAFIEVENTRLGKATSTVHLKMFQKDVQKAAAYAT